MTINILLKPYQTSWQTDYENWLYELSQVLDLDEQVQFEQFGSTAIPGVIAKPTIDILLGVANVNVFHANHSVALESLGFDYVQTLESEFPYRRYYQLLDDQGNHLVHLHVVVKGGCFWQRHLLFRDYLLQHSAKVTQYSALKERALLQAKTRDDYTAAKTEFVFDCLRDAFSDGTLQHNFSKHQSYLAVQPQHFMSDIVDQLYSNRNDLDKDLMHWDHYGFGPLWWFDKGKQLWIARAGWLQSDLGEAKRKWFGDAMMRDWL